MNDSVPGLLLSDLNLKGDFCRTFEEISESSSRFPFLFNISDEEAGDLPVDKSVFHASTRLFSQVKHGFKENRIFSIMFDNLRFHGSGYTMYGKYVIMDSLTPTYFSGDSSSVKGVFSDCKFMRGNTLIDRLASNYLNDSPGKILDSRKTYVLPFGRLCHNFGHWHLNALSSIYFAKKYFPESLIVVPPLNEWQKNCLDLFGLYDQEKFITIDPLLAGGCTVPNAIVVSTTFVWNGLNNCKPILSLFSHTDLHSRTTSRTKQQSTDYPKRIYLSRKSEKLHKLINEDLVEDEFKKNNFAIIEPQKLPYDELACMVANASHLAGPNGAALVRSGMCKPGAKIIQLCYEGCPDYWIHKHSSLSGASKSYVYLEGPESIVNDAKANPGNHHAHIEGWKISIDSLGCFLREIT
jgi:capsular polysaccharide biosynthesis protein